MSLAAAAGAVNVLQDAVGEARESQKVGAVTEQIIKSTGSAANVTADEVGNLATAISNKSGVDDEAIQSGANLLLTFKNVANQAGDGANVFDRATQAAADLSAAGFGSMDGAARQLGKALNDPVAGISALARSGVTFTDQQKEQIATLVESGNVLDAQKIILAEVESQVGGAAEASATAGEKMSVAFGNFKETLGTALLPAIDGVQGALTGLFGFFSENQPVLYAVLGVIGLLTAAWVANAAASTAVTAAENLKTIALGVGRGVMTAVTAAQWLWNAAMSANPIGIIIVAIAALIAIVVLLVKNWDTVKAAGAAAWEWIKDAWSGAADWFSGIGDAIVDAFKGAFNWVASGWNDTVGSLSWTVPDWIPGIGGKTLSVPNIPMLAEGGVITSPTLAMVGEGREAEAVLPLSKLEDMLSPARGRGGPLVEQKIYPTPGMSETQVGNIAGRKAAQALVGVGL